MPCLNEEGALLLCIEETKKTINKYNLNAEIIIVDNGSTDKSIDIIEKSKQETPSLVLLHEPNKGYGSAYQKGLRGAQGKYIFMADADFSYEFSDIPRFVEKLKEGNDMVIGNRFMNHISNRAMPWHHKYIGNPLFSFLIKKTFKVNIGDIHCGARAFKSEILGKINFNSNGMEFASEMIIEVTKAKLRIIEIPIQYRERIGKSKLNFISDGLRHLKLILSYTFQY